MKALDYSFLRTAGRILNSGQARSLILTGEVHDLYFVEDDAGPRYLPLIDFLIHHWNVSDRMIVVYELNGPIRFLREEDEQVMREAWLRWRTGLDSDEAAIQRMLNPSGDKLERQIIEQAFDGPAFRFY